MKIEEYKNLTTLIKISLDTELNTWWANSKLGSDIVALLKTGKVNNTTLLKLYSSAKEALNWLLEDELVKEMDILIAQDKVNKNRINFNINIVKPDGNDDRINYVYNLK